MVKGDHCPCIAVNHGHAAGQCDEPEPPQGPGVCLTCRYAGGSRVPSPDELADAIRSSNLTFDQRAAIYALIDGSRM